MEEPGQGWNDPVRIFAEPGFVFRTSECKEQTGGEGALTQPRGRGRDTTRQRDWHEGACCGRGGALGGRWH